MVWLHERVTILKTSLLVSTEYTNLTDRRTDTARRHMSRLVRWQKSLTHDAQFHRSDYIKTSSESFSANIAPHALLTFAR